MAVMTCTDRVANTVEQAWPGRAGGRRFSETADSVDHRSVHDPATVVREHGARMIAVRRPLRERPPLLSRAGYACRVTRSRSRDR